MLARSEVERVGMLCIGGSEAMMLDLADNNLKIGGVLVRFVVEGIQRSMP